MTNEKKHDIAMSFPDTYETQLLDLEISGSEFKIFEDGIFAGSMDDKWNIFVLGNTIYFARSWTNFCIYKVFFRRNDASVILSEFQVSRDDSQYKSKDIKQDMIRLKQLLQFLLKRDDIYQDPKLELPLIKSTLEKMDPKNEYKKRLSSNNVGLTRQLYNAITSEHQKKYMDISGWQQLEERIASKSADELLINLHVLNTGDDSSTTYYFDNEAKELLGQVRIKTKNISF